MSIIDNIINNRDFDIKLSTIYLQYKKETEKKIAYEEFIKLLQRQIFLWLRDEVLGIKLPLPDKFVTFRSYTKSHNENSNIETFAYFSYKVKSEKLLFRKNEKVTKIQKVKIGSVIDRDMPLKLFIENMGHEMVHYVDLYYIRRAPLAHGRIFKLILWSFNVKIRVDKKLPLKLVNGFSCERIIINTEELNNCYLE